MNLPRMIAIPKRSADALRRTLIFAASYPEVVAVAAFGLWSRAFISSSRGYWLDELFSVYLWGKQLQSLPELLSEVFENAVHLPLFPTVLWLWMWLGGHDESFTRLLSNILVTLGVAIIHVLFLRHFSRGISLLAHLSAAVSFTAMFHGSETRYYSLVILLSLASLAVLWRILLTLGQERKVWQENLRLHRLFVVYGLVNLALLFTHLYTIFFIGTQFFYLLFLSIVGGGRMRGELVKVVGSGVILPGVLWGVLWGPTLTRAMSFFGESYETGDEPAFGPIDAMGRFVIGPNWTYSPGVLALVLVVFLGVRVVLRLFAHNRVRSQEAFGSPGRFVEFLLFHLVVPLFLVYFIFALTGYERFADRYFVWSAILLGPLLVGTVGDLTDKITSGATMRPLQTAKFPVAIVLVALLGLSSMHSLNARLSDTFEPQVRAAAEYADLLEPAPIILEASWGSLMSNYYFERFSETSRATGSFYEPRQGDALFVLCEQMALNTEAEQFLVVFTHLEVGRFKTLNGILSDNFEVASQDLDASGRGFMAFEITGAFRSSCSER